MTGDNGKVVIEDGKLSFWKLNTPEREFNREYTGGFGQPKATRIEIPVSGKETGHIGILENFVDAIREGAPLLAPGEEGIRGLSIANSMLLSTWTDDWAPVPPDEEFFLEKLDERIRSSSYKNDTVDRAMNVDGTFG